MLPVAPLRIPVTLDDAGLRAGFARTRAMTSVFAKDVADDIARAQRGALAGSVSVLDSFRGAAGPALLGVGAGVFIKSVISDIAQVKDQAERAQLSIRDLQTLTFAARQGGGTQDDLVGIMTKFNKELGIAATEGNKLKEILDANGVPLRDMNGQMRSNKALFFDVVDLIHNARTEGDKSVIAMSAFGRSAAEALPYLQDGAQALRDQEAAAIRLGVVMDTELVKKADELDDRLTAGFDRLKTNIGAGLLTAIVEAEKIGAHIDAVQRQVEEDQKRRAGPHREIIKLDEERLRLIRAIDNAMATGVGLPLLEEWKQNLIDINAELSKMGPAWERTGRGGVLARTLPGVARNPFETARGTRVPVTSDPFTAPGLPPGFIDRLIQVESRGVADIRNPLSSATGHGQFIESTWMRLIPKVIGEEVAAAMGRRALDLRTDPAISRQMIELLAKENAAALRSAGFAASERNLYAAHFLGAGGALSALRADPNALAESVLGGRAATANPTVIGGGRSIGDVWAYIDRVMGAAGTPGMPRGQAFGPQLPGKGFAFMEGADQELARAQINATADAMRRLGGETHDAIAAAEAYRFEQEKLLEAQRAGITLTDEELAALKRKSEIYGELAAKSAEVKEGQADLQQESEALGQSLGQGLADLVTKTGTWRDLIRGAIPDVINLVTEFLKLGGTDTGGVGALAGSFLANIFHEGGIVGSTRTPLRLVSAAQVAGAPRLHGGNLRPNERVAVLEDGERVVSRAGVALARAVRFGAGGLPPITIGGPQINVQGDATERTLELIARQSMIAAAEQRKELQRTLGAVSSRYQKDTG
jgi:ABC-type phosphate transport system auxiliary subunit